MNDDENKVVVKTVNAEQVKKSAGVEKTFTEHMKSNKQGVKFKYNFTDLIVVMTLVFIFLGIMALYIFVNNYNKTHQKEEKPSIRTTEFVFDSTTTTTKKQVHYVSDTTTTKKKVHYVRE